MADEFVELEGYLRKVPAIGPANEGCLFGKGRFDNGNWWVKFSIEASKGDADILSILRTVLSASPFRPLESPPNKEEKSPPTKRRIPDLEDCEAVGQTHKWFNVDDASSGCYNCRVVRPGQLWRR